MRIFKFSIFKSKKMYEETKKEIKHALLMNLLSLKVLKESWYL